jgi:hypothetical protein
MIPRSPAAIILALCLLALAPAAWASPPDPAWFEGIYDEVVLGTATAGGNAVALMVERLSFVQPGPILEPGSLSADASGVRSVWLTSSRDRSPPGLLRAS